MKGQTLEATINVNIDEQMGSIFAYTGNYQEYIVPNDGYYEIELWGASGGHVNATSTGGLGGYSKGTAYFNKDEKIYVYIGGYGENNVTITNIGGYNGGGFSGNNSGANSMGGGGATDIRYFGSYIPTEEELKWNSTLGLNSRIMVAGGGGGSASGSTTKGGAGGGLIGGSGTSSNSTYNTSTYLPTGGTQIATGNSYNKAKSGSFGQSFLYYSDGWGGGGGSGYYGGSNGHGTTGSGGSSFISGYAGVNAILESTDEANPRTHSGNTIHYSGKYFLNGEMLPGTNDGNGKAQITYIGEKPERVNTNLDNVRYIKDCVNGYNATTGNHWVELQAIKDGINLAKGIIPTGTVVQNDTYPYSRITDGDITSTVYAASNSTGTQCITIDLTEPYNLDEIAVWHYYVDGRTYKDNILSVSEDEINWIDIIKDTSNETNLGKRVNAYK